MSAVKGMQKISGGAGGYFASPGSHPAKAGAFAPRKTVAKPSERRQTRSPIEDNLFAECLKEKTSERLLCLNLGFRKLYDRGDFPISVNHDAKGNKINWKVCTSFSNNRSISKN